eukprot:jgi/Mesvir1/18703/Mv17187-RA.2
MAHGGHCFDIAQLDAWHVVGCACRGLKLWVALIGSFRILLLLPAVACPPVQDFVGALSLDSFAVFKCLEALPGVDPFSLASMSSAVLRCLWRVASGDNNIFSIDVISSEPLICSYRRTGPEVGYLNTSLAVSVPSPPNDPSSIAWVYAPDPVTGLPIIDGPVVKVCSLGACPVGAGNVSTGSVEILVADQVYVPSFPPLKQMPWWLAAAGLGHGQSTLRTSMGLLAGTWQPTLVLARPLHDPVSGDVSAVLTISYQARTIIDYLVNLPVVTAMHGVAYVATWPWLHLLSATNGSLVAPQDVAGSANGSVPVHLPATQSDDIVVRTSAWHMSTNFGSLLLGQECESLVLVPGRGRHYVDSRPLSLHDLSLTIFLAVPVGSFRQDMDASMRRSLLYMGMSVVAIFVAGLCGIVLATVVMRRIHDRVARDNQWMQKHVDFATSPRAIMDDDWPNLDMQTAAEKLHAIIRSLQGGDVLSGRQVAMMQELAASDDMHKPQFLNKMEGGSSSSRELDSETGAWLTSLTQHCTLPKQTRPQSSASASNPLRSLRTVNSLGKGTAEEIMVAQGLISPLASARMQGPPSPQASASSSYAHVLSRRVSRDRAVSSTPSGPSNEDEGAGRWLREVEEVSKALRRLQEDRASQQMLLLASGRGSSATLLPAPERLSSDQWGNQPFMSSQIEYVLDFIGGSQDNVLSPVGSPPSHFPLLEGSSPIRSSSLLRRDSRETAVVAFKTSPTPDAGLQGGLVRALSRRDLAPPMPGAVGTPLPSPPSRKRSLGAPGDRGPARVPGAITPGSHRSGPSERDASSREITAKELSSIGLADALQLLPAGSSIELGSPCSGALSGASQVALVEHLTRLGSWQLDTQAVAQASGGRPILFVGYLALQSAGLIEEFTLPGARLVRFLLELDRGMDPEALYHSAAHIADVTGSLHHLLMESGVGQHLRKVDHLAALVAALVHDYKHPGVSNDFILKMGGELAMRYNDRSPLENFHLSEAFELMSADGFNFLRHLASATYAEIRHIVIEMVLATDLKNHFRVLDKFKTRLLTLHDKPWDRDSESDRMLLLRMALKVADLGHTCKSLELHQRWAELIVEEFYTQGDAEIAAQVDVSPFMDRANANVPKAQCGFFHFLVLPMVDAWVKAFPHSTPLLAHLFNNAEYWIMLARRKEATSPTE